MAVVTLSVWFTVCVTASNKTHWNLKSCKNLKRETQYVNAATFYIQCLLPKQSTLNLIHVG